MKSEISRRSFLKQAGVVSVGLAIAGCVAPAAGPTQESAAGDEGAIAQEAAHITMWGGAFLMNANQELWDASDYSKEHPHISFETTPMPYDQYSQKMAVAISAGETDPDVLLIHYPFIKDFTGKGLLVDLTEGVERDQFSPNVFEPVIESDAVFGVPYEIATFVNFYREDVLAELGLELPATRDAYFEAGNVIQEKTGQFWSILDKASGNISLFQSALLMLEGNIFSADGEVILDTDAGKGVEAASPIPALRCRCLRRRRKDSRR